jgi:hypothetical protein
MNARNALLRLSLILLTTLTALSIACWSAHEVLIMVVSLRDASQGQLIVGGSLGGVSIALTHHLALRLLSRDGRWNVRERFVFPIATKTPPSEGTPSLKESRDDDQHFLVR